MDFIFTYRKKSKHKNGMVNYYDIDRSKFYSVIKSKKIKLSEIENKTGIKKMHICRIISPIKNQTGAYPEDIHKICLAVGLNYCDVVRSNNA